MATMTVIPTPPAQAVTLYQIEERLQALLDTEEVVPPEQLEEFQQELAVTLLAATEKRDRIHHFLCHCETQAGLAAQEIIRLQARKAMFDAVAERVEQYVVRVIKDQGADSKGKYRKLEGNAVTLSLRKCPVSVDITDEGAVPEAFKTISMRMPAETWEIIIEALDMQFAAQVLEQVFRPEISVSKTLVKRALETNGVIPGARLVTDKHSLVRR